MSDALTPDEVLRKLESARDAWARPIFWEGEPIHTMEFTVADLARQLLDAREALAYYFTKEPMTLQHFEELARACMPETTDE